MTNVVTLHHGDEGYRNIARIQADFIAELRSVAEDVVGDWAYECCDKHDDCACSMARLVRLLRD